MTFELTAETSLDRPIETTDQRALRLAAVEAAVEPAVAYSHFYDDDEHVAEHEHGRAQLLHPSVGVVTVTTRAGRWMVPPGHALWIPAGVRHAVDTIGRVDMHSVYVLPDAIAGLPAHLHVTGLTPLMRCLIAEAIRLRSDAATPRAGFILGALLHEILQLPQRPLGLPFPSQKRLAQLCREYLVQPTAHLKIDHWADAAGMSRRSFTRVFRAETGLSLSTWRQQACLMAALPRLSAGETVTAVALDLGYDSVPAFTTMFCRVMGTPPKTYLRAQAVN
ncbi:DNA-binding domain-containing protein, AraC-type [Hoeflea sp. IMCC20628]|uniref:AraC family transcriptional regulator n=1 Tax=Hoeflea sp. IMCC20628 TaxID=1620421 RepID=UPI00063BE086|nr:helix-turn-helix transcriptional regulator [Hoeflea sp. IMCC20628]AKI00609.1 DNA-binding domain-containing protein, AraC-type [Hoeflea sp. IMCC20628]